MPSDEDQKRSAMNAAVVYNGAGVNRPMPLGYMPPPLPPFSHHSPGFQPTKADKDCDVEGQGYPAEPNKGGMRTVAEPKINLKPLYAGLCLVGAISLATLGLVAFNAHQLQPGLPTTSEDKSAAAEWGYEDPNKLWTGLCQTGKQQSPINIVPDQAGAAPASQTKINMASFQDVSNKVITDFFNMHKMTYNGHAVLADNVQEFFSFDCVDYKLLQFHFHTPSEHVVDGKNSDAEVHFVHQDLMGELLVISVLVNEGASTPAFLHEIASKVSPDQGAAAIVTFDMAQALADIGIKEDSTPYWSLKGSLTTPPCSEGVQWIVLQNQITATKADLQRLRDMEHVNNRPPQPLNGRVVNYLN